MIATIGLALGAAVIGIFLLTAVVGAPYVPTHRKQVRRAFSELRALNRSDTLVDMGSGDGVVLAEALAAGVGQAVGYEINPFLVVISRFRLRGRYQNTRITTANFWRTPFPSDTTVVYTFGETRDIAKMYDRVQSEADRLGREIDFISYAFTVPGKVVLSQVGAHYLYRVTPLQSLQT